ncbi:MAG: DsbC family protein [Nitrospirae bacterium]|nr:DsbC family protein [Nitrospirota bacterium]MBF0592283.1 DsbC family protein [Nitrospirota bacterium]
MNNKGLMVIRRLCYVWILVAWMTFIASAQVNAQTAEKDAQAAPGQPKQVNLDKAVRIGMGRNIVVEFTDPDCPYCRKLADYMSKRKDVTRYVFLFPLVQLHPQAQEKARFILCSKNSAKTLEDVMSGKYDKDKLPTCKSAQAEQLLEEHKKMAESVGVTSTPTLIVNGQLVQGANFELIEKIIGPNQIQ